MQLPGFAWAHFTRQPAGRPDISHTHTDQLSVRPSAWNTHSRSNSSPRMEKIKGEENSLPLTEAYKWKGRFELLKGGEVVLWGWKGFFCRSLALLSQSPADCTYVLFTKLQRRGEGDFQDLQSSLWDRNELRENSWVKDGCCCSWCSSNHRRKSCMFLCVNLSVWCPTNPLHIDTYWMS